MGNTFDDAVVATSDVSGNYITKADLTNYGVSISDVEDAHLAMLIADVEKAIDRHTGDQFYLSSGVTKYFDGNGRDTLYFMPATSLRLRNLTSVDIWNIITSSVTTTLTETEDYIVDDSDEYILRVDGGTWPKGVRNVRVIGDWGWTSCPDPIRWCAALMIALRVDPNFKGLHTDAALSWPHLSVGRVVTGRKLSPILGVPSIDTILWSYRRVTSLMIVP